MEEVAFSKTGRAYTENERRELWKRKGQCSRCGIQTHKIVFFMKTPLTNDDVYEGKCIKCEPRSVPKKVLSEWEVRREKVVSNELWGRSTRANVDDHHLKDAPVAATATVTTAAAVAVSSQKEINPQGLWSKSDNERSGTERHRKAHSFSSPEQRQKLVSHSSWKSLPAVPVLEPTAAASSPTRRGSDSTTVSSASTNTSTLTSLLTQSKGSLMMLNRNPSFQTTFDWMDAVLDQCSQCANAHESTPIVRVLCQIPDDYDVTLLSDISQFERFLVKLRPTIVSIKENAFWVALASVMWKLLLIGSDIAKHFSNQGYHVLFLERLKQPSCDREGTECLLATLALFIGFEPDAFLHSGMETIVNLLHKFREARTLEWVSKCLYGMLCRTQSPEKLLSMLNQDIATLLKATCHSGGLDAPQIWGLRVLFAMYQLGNDRRRESLLITWEKNDTGFALMERIHRQDFQIDPHAFQVECHIFRTLIERNDALKELAVSCILRIIQTHVDSKGESDDSNWIQSILRLLAICTMHGSPNVRHRLSSSICDCAVKIMSTNSMEKHPHVTSSSAWILWNLSETMELTLEQAQQVLQAFRSFLEDQQNGCVSAEYTDSILLAIYSFLDNVCNISGLTSSDFPLQSIVTVSTANTPSANLRRLEAKAITNLHTKFPDVATHARTIASHLINTLYSTSNRDLMQDSDCTRSAVVSLLCYSSRIPSVNELLTSTTMVESLMKVLSQSTDDHLIEDALDLLLSIVSENSRLVDIPQRLLDVVTSLATGSRSTSCRQKASLTLQVLCVTCVSIASVRAVENYLSSALSTSAPPKHKVEAFRIVSSLHTRGSVQGEGAFFYKILQALTIMFRGLLENSDDIHYDPSFILAATAALARASKQVQQPISSEDAETVVSMIYFIMGHERDAPSALECILLAVLHLCAVNKNLFICHGIIVAIIDAMDECDGNAVIQEKGCAILALLAASRSLQEIMSIVQTDGVDVLLCALAQFPDNVNIQRNVCAAFSHLTIDQEARMLISSEGGVLLLMMAMEANRECVVLQERACVALQNIIADSSDPVEPSLVEAVVTAMMSYPDCPTLQESALAIVQMASAQRGSALQDAVTRLHGIEAILTSVRAFPSEPSILEFAFGALRNFAFAKTKIVQNDGIQLVINGMLANIENDRVQKNGFGCLGMLASSSDVCSKIRGAGGVTAIILGVLVHYDCATTVREGFVALSTLASSEVEPQDKEIYVVVTIMNRYPTSSDVQDYGCRILRGYLTSRRNLELALDACGMKKIESVLQRAKTDFPSRCASNAMAVLSSL